jgi:hypothetical protein
MIESQMPRELDATFTTPLARRRSTQDLHITGVSGRHGLRLGADCSTCRYGNVMEESHFDLHVSKIQEYRRVIGTQFSPNFISGQDSFPVCHFTLLNILKLHEN